MGTRADVYLGRGEQAEWLGSIAWDGDPDGVQAAHRTYGEHGRAMLRATDEKAFREAVKAFLAAREDDATLPEMGWPWPWENSRTTDFAYAFDGGKVWASCFGYAWFDPLLPMPESDGPKSAVFPDMTHRQKVTMGPRSGLIVLGM
jgi:hypothetical protein